MAAPAEHTSFDLVMRAQAGDADALDKLIRRHLPGLRAFVRARSGPVLRMRESSSDLVQTVCREALRSLKDYQWRGEGSFRYWLFTVATHKLTNKADYHGAEKRNPAREVELGPEDASQKDNLAEIYKTVCTPSQHAIAHEVVENVEAALDRLDDQYRDVILMSRVAGLDTKEIAERLDKSEGAVRVLLSRALARLAAAMEAVEKDSERG